MENKAASLALVGMCSEIWHKFFCSGILARLNPEDDADLKRQGYERIRYKILKFSSGKYV